MTRWEIHRDGNTHRRDMLTVRHAHGETYKRRNIHTEGIRAGDMHMKGTQRRRTYTTRTCARRGHNLDEHT